MRLAVLLLAACSACSPVAPAPHGPRYPLHPRIRSASGGPIELRGAIANPGVIPYSPGITFTCALRLAGGPTALATPRASMRRGVRSFILPLHKIINHTAPDPELAPGDVVTIGSFAE